MAAPGVNKVKKLYFDVVLTRQGGSTSDASLVVNRCTGGALANTYAGDRDGGVLDDFPALSASSANALKRKSEVSAWFAATSLSFPTVAGAVAPALVDFVQWTSVASGATPLPSSGSTPSGATAIVTRHFGVRVRAFRTLTGNFILKGVLYVQRQHTIEV